jgi:hypothetical protein
MPVEIFRKEYPVKFLISLIAVAFLATPAQLAPGNAPDARPFRISSIGTAFGVQALVDGDYVIEGDRLRLRISKAEIRVSEHCPYKGRRQLSQLRIGLGTRVEGRSWKIDQKGQSFLLSNVMSPGDKFEFSDVYLDIPLDPSIDLSTHWLVLQIEEIALDLPSDKGDRKGYAFAHSACDVFNQASYEAKARDKGTVIRRCV